jgi:hypothetical protein
MLVFLIFVILEQGVVTPCLISLFASYPFGSEEQIHLAILTGIENKNSK